MARHGGTPCTPKFQTDTVNDLNKHLVPGETCKDVKLT